jgi:hypothetical protein
LVTTDLPTWDALQLYILPFRPVSQRQQNFPASRALGFRGYWLRCGWGCKSCITDRARRPAFAPMQENLRHVSNRGQRPPSCRRCDDDCHVPRMSKCMWLASTRKGKVSAPCSRRA